MPYKNGVISSTKLSLPEIYTSIYGISSQGVRMDLNKKDFYQANDYCSMKGDHIEVQKTMFENLPHQDALTKYSKDVLG